MSVGDFKDASKAVYRFLTDDGLVVDGTNHNMAVDGTTPVPYYYKAAVPAVIERCIVHVRDGGVWTEVKFGSLASLTNGVTLGVHRNGVVILDLFGGITMQENQDWNHVCYDVDIRSVGSGESYLGARYTFAKSGQPVLLRKNDSLVATVSDNLAALTDFHIMIQGYQI